MDSHTTLVKNLEVNFDSMAEKPFDTIAEINCCNSFILNWKNDKFCEALCGII